MIYYTHDEEGNSMMHIVGSQATLDTFREMGFKDEASPEEYERHMASCRRRAEKEWEEFDKWIEDFKRLLGSKE